MNKLKLARLMKILTFQIFPLALIYILWLISGLSISQAQQKETQKEILLMGTPERANKIVDESIAIVKGMTSQPNKNLPPAILRNAAGVAVIPDMVKAGFVPGGRRGEGVLLVNEIREWSRPVFLNI